MDIRADAGEGDVGILDGEASHDRAFIPVSVLSLGLQRTIDAPGATRGGQGQSGQGCDDQKLHVSVSANANFKALSTPFIGRLGDKFRVSVTQAQHGSMLFSAAIFVLSP